MLFEKRKAKLIYIVKSDYGISAAELPLTQTDGEVSDNDCVSDETDRIPRELSVERYQLACFALSIVSHIFDHVSDIYVGMEHYLAGRFISSVFILLFAAVPSIVLNIVSFAWICDDNYVKLQKDSDRPKRKYLLHGILSICQLGPVWWQYQAFCYAYRFRQESCEKTKRKLFCRMVEAERDATLLRFFEGFLEAAPQLLIQSVVLVDFIMVHYFETNGSISLPRWAYAQLLSMAFSLFSMCWSITSQHRTIRMVRHNKVNMHPHETIIQLIWRISTVTSRIIILTICLIYYRIYAVVLIVCHFFISLVHVTALQSIDTGTSSSALEVGLILINAGIHTFTPFNMADGPTRTRYCVAYFFEFVEGVVLSTFVILDTDFMLPFKLELIYIYFGSFTTGICVMMTYYTCFHPNRRRNKRIPEINEDC